MFTFISLVSGSSGNATLVSDGNTNILIDCGMSGKQLEKSLAFAGFSADGLNGVLVTHEHIDHTKGVGVIARRYDLPVYATEPTINSMEIGKVERFVCIKSDTDFEIGNIGIHPFTIPHDAADPVGYVFTSSDERVALATDLGHMNEYLLSNLYGCRKILLESNHDTEMLKLGPYPYNLKKRILSDHGHLSNDDAAETVIDLINHGTEHILLGHLSQQNNHPQIALMTTQNALSAAGITSGRDVTLDVADRFCVTRFPS